MQSRQGEVLATAYGDKILMKDLNETLFTEGGDSSAIIGPAIDDWLRTQIMYQEALSSLGKMDRLDVMADAYKKDLYIHALEKKWSAEEMDTSLSQAEVDTFIAHHPEKFLVDEPLMQILMVKVKKGYEEEKLNTLWKTEDLPGLRAYMQGAEGLALLEVDRWHQVREIEAFLPDSLLRKLSLSQLRSHSLSWGDELFYLKTLDYLKKEASLPQAMVREKVKSQILKDRFKKSLNERKRQLYQNKLSSKDIEIIYPNE